MTRRGLGVLGCGLAALAIGWAFGTSELYVVGFGQLALLALALVASAAELRGAVLVRTLPLEAQARQALGVDVLVRGRRRRLGSATLAEPRAPGGGAACALAGGPSGLAGSYRVASASRGRYVLEGARLVCEDPFAVVRLSARLAARDVLLVRPRVLDLTAAPGHGAGEPTGGSLPAAAAAGFDLRGVRAHRDGESLRHVHWPSTARVGRLMVKEFDDETRDDVAIALDLAAPSERAAEAFEVALEAALALARRAFLRGERAALILLGESAERLELGSSEQWELLLDALASVQPMWVTSPAQAWPAGAAQAGELWLVTSAPDRLDAGFLAARADEGRLVVVAVDAAGWDPGLAPVDRSALAAGWRTLVIERDDDLRDRLERLEERPRSIA